MTGLRTAVGFLTVLPTGRGEWQPVRAVAWYPVVAVVLAVLLIGAVTGLYEAFTPLLAAALTLTVWVILSGGLHLDGLADSADAAFAPVSRERRLAIVSDVHHGTFALVAVVLVLLVKFSALASLNSSDAAAAAFLAVVAGRCLLPLVIRTFPSARPDGMGAAVREGATLPVVGFGAGVGILAGVFAFGWVGGIVSIGLGLAAIGAGWWLAGRLGGLTGDTYGAIVELVEVVALVSVAALVTHGHVSAFGGRL